MSRRIPLCGPRGRGLFAIVEDDDAASVAAHRWYLEEDGPRLYARANVRTPSGRRTTLRMHRLILDVPGVDHRDGNGLNNLRSNLRAASGSQNCGNARPQNDRSSRHKGVDWRTDLGRWQARIRFHGRRRSLGFFDSEDEAGRAYDVAALAQWGEFAWLNFPEEAPIGHP